MHKKTPVMRCMQQWCAGVRACVRAKECIILEVSPAFNDDEYVWRPTVAEQQQQQQAYFQPCRSNYLKSECLQHTRGMFVH